MNNEIHIRPGALNTDTAENVLGAHEFVQVQNLRQDKFGNWINEKGVKAVHTAANSYKSAIEITDDLSGDRFILAHGGTNLYKISYSGGAYGSASALSLPSGVTLTTDDDLRYFYHNGVIRISGASEPMRYEYIKRASMQTAIELIDTDDFESDTESWTGASATLSRDNSDSVVEDYSLKIAPSAADGRAKKTFTVVNEADYILRGWVKSSGAKKISVGSSDNGEDLGTAEIASSVTDWTEFEVEFTASGTSAFVAINPDDVAGPTDGWADYVRLYQVVPAYDAETWYLTTAKVETTDKVKIGEFLPLSNGETARDIQVRGFLVYDGAQYSLPFDLDLLTPTETLNPNTNKLGVMACVHEDLFNNQRVTGLGLLAQTSLVDGDDTLDLKWVTEIIDFTEDAVQEDAYLHANLYWDNGTPGYLLLYGVGTNVWYLNNGMLAPGNRVTLSNSNGSITGEILSYGTANPGGGDNLMVAIQLDCPLDDILDQMTISHLLPTTTITVERRWMKGIDYTTLDSNSNSVSDSYYCFWFLLNVIGGTDYHELTGIPAGTSQIAYDYSHIAIVNNRPYIISNEEDEGDLIRYGPLYQYDVFPSINYFQTEVGDADENKAIIALDDRLVVLKEHSISKMSYVANSFNSDVGVGNRGLYATNGYIVIDHVLYYMDKKHVWAFDGYGTQPLLSNAKVIRYYREHVSTASFMGYMRERNELFMWLSSGRCLVWDMDKNLWSTRYYYDYDGDAALDIRMFLNNYDRQMLGVTSGVFYNFGEFSGDSAIKMKSLFETRLMDYTNPEQFKRLIWTVLNAKCNYDLTVTLTDDNDGDSLVLTLTPDSGNIQTVEDVLNTLSFRALQITVETGAQVDTDLEFNLLKFGVRQWR